ncbi:MAG: GTP-binding protein HSR1, partial [Thioalkalivibrio sp.]|nr:GTP-binding protein HSR1 [Thioalkalivibrio sp.]
VQNVIAVRLDPPDQLYNIDLVWALLGAHYHEARRCRAQRLQLQASPRDWKRVLHQAAGAGRLLKRRVIG